MSEVHRTKRIGRWAGAFGVVLAVVALGVLLTRPSSPDHPPKSSGPRGVAALVNGQRVPLALYQRDVDIFRVTLPGPMPRNGSPAWRAREEAVDDRALRQAIVETIIVSDAARRRLTATSAAVQSELERMRAEAGGAAAFAAIMRAERLTNDDVHTMALTAVLDELLQQKGGPHLVDRLYAQARVSSYVGPHPIERGLAPAPIAGHPAPDVAATTLGGRPVTLTGLRGTPVVLNIWATTCTWCRFEMPMLDAFAHTHPHIRVVELDVGEDRGTVISYARALGLHLSIWLDQSGAAAGAYRISGLPDTFVIDRAGVVRSVMFGAVSGQGALRRLVSPVIG